MNYLLLVIFLGIVIGLAVGVSSMISSSSSSSSLGNPELLKCNPIRFDLGEMGETTSDTCTTEEIDNITFSVEEESHYYTEIVFKLNNGTTIDTFYAPVSDECLFTNPPPWDDQSELVADLNGVDVDYCLISYRFIENGIGNLDACSPPLLPNTSAPLQRILSRLRRSS